MFRSPPCRGVAAYRYSELNLSGRRLLCWRSHDDVVRPGELRVFGWHHYFRLAGIRCQWINNGRIVAPCQSMIPRIFFESGSIKTLARFKSGCRKIAAVSWVAPSRERHRRKFVTAADVLGEGCRFPTLKIIDSNGSALQTSNSTLVPWH
jgi:hypothetical protein